MEKQKLNWLNIFKMLSKEKINEMCNQILNNLRTKEDELKDLNKQITQDTNHWIEYDYQNVIMYVSKFNNNFDFEEKIKSKRKILIILSHNEPFIMNIVPVLNALSCGNITFVKTSKKTIHFFKKIWEGVAYKNLRLIEDNLKFEDIRFKNHIKNVSSIYFYGSHDVAKRLYPICAEYFKEFHPELEGADSKVFYFNKNISENKIREDVIQTFEQSFSHIGQICQRIHGVYIDANNHGKYIGILKEEFDKFINNEGQLNLHIPKGYLMNKKYYLKIKEDIKQSKPKEVLNKNKVPLIIINPQKQSNLVKNAYFFPLLWVCKVNSINDLIKNLNERKYFLGLNIISDKMTTKKIINGTNFSRYTLNANHISTIKDKGWGGNYPTGFTGYKKWLENFGNIYNILK